MIAAKIDIDDLEVVKYFVVSPESNLTDERPLAMVKDPEVDDGVYLLGWENGEFEDVVEVDGESLLVYPSLTPCRVSEPLRVISGNVMGLNLNRSAIRRPSPSLLCVVHASTMLASRVCPVFFVRKYQNMYAPCLLGRR